MFTGLVECTSRLLQKTALESGEKISFSHDFGPLTLGESIAVNGACLTVIAFDDKQFTVELSPETLELTTLGKLAEGQSVNLERAVAVGDRLGGHMVSGHVDGVATISRLEPSGDMTVVGLSLPVELARYVAKKGSITVDGVSLTVNEVSGTTAELLLIPHTQEVTTFSDLKLGQEVNIEVDLIARYVERLLSAPKSEN